MFWERKDTKEALAIYRRHYLQSAVLEILAQSGPTDNSRFHKRILLRVRENDNIRWAADTGDVREAAAYLISIGFIEVLPKERINITPAGVKALRECVLQNLAAGSYSNLKMLKWAILATRAARFAAGAAVVAAIATVIGLLV